VALDPEIAQFHRYLVDAFAAYPQFEMLPPVEARRIMETLRAPLARGGPVMADTIDRSLVIDGVPVQVRLHIPAVRKAAPALIYLHGGGWVLFSLDTHDRIMREYAARAGVVVAGVAYALAPEARFPTALRQVVGVLRWLRKHGAEFGIDPERLAVGGDSVGANLAMASALALRDSGEVADVKALVLNYGVYDTDFDRRSYRQYGSPDKVLTRSEMISFWNHYIAGEQDLLNPLACLARADVAGLPAAFLAIAEQDPLYDENIAMSDKLFAAGVPVKSVVYPGTTHSFLEAVSMAEVSRRALAEASDWLRQTLSLEGPPGNYLPC
jgi:acetyl esterase